MVTITDTFTIAVITIAIITIAIITITILSISSSPNGHTYAHNSWEASSRFRWNIWVGDLLSPRSNCLPFLQNQRLQLSTPGSWGIIRFRLSERAKHLIQTMVSTDVMNLAAATRHPPPATRLLPPASRYLSPGSWRLQLNRWTKHAWAYSEGVQFSTGSFWLLEISDCVEALANRSL